MAVRILSSILLFPILAVLIAIGGVPLQVALMLLSVTGLYEIYKALTGKIIKVHYIGFAFCALYYALISVVNSTLTLFLYTLFMISVLVFLVINHSAVSIVDCAYTVFGFFYVVFLMSFVFWVRDYNFGKFSVWLIFISAWGSDTGAYFTGKSIGRHKLTPVLSKNKTVEGAIGGVITATILAFIYGWLVSGLLSFEEINTIAFSAILGCAGSIFSQFGDLTASAIKRATGIKDFGNIIPGHGGILDRFDSILFTAPIVFFVMYLLLRFTMPQ